MSRITKAGRSDIFHSPEVRAGHCGISVADAVAMNYFVRTPILHYFCIVMVVATMPVKDFEFFL